jgi:hypothetical protein
VKVTAKGVVALPAICGALFVNVHVVDEPVPVVDHPLTLGALPATGNVTTALRPVVVAAPELPIVALTSSLVVSVAW